MRLLSLAACLLSVAGHRAAKPDIIVVGFVHWIGWFSPDREKVTAEISGSPVYAPTLFGAGRTAWNLCSFDATASEPFELARSNPNAHVDSWPLSFKRLKLLGIPVSGRYDNTHEEFYSGNVVGFDHGDPLVAFGSRLLRFKNGIWSNYRVSGWDESGKFIEVRDDAAIVLKESNNHVLEIADSPAGTVRTDLGQGGLETAIGIGKNSLLVSVVDEHGEDSHLRLWKTVGAATQRIGEWSASGAVLTSDGQIYLETRGGVDPTSRHKAFSGWTKLRPITEFGQAKMIRVAGDVSVSDIDPITHRVWGVRTEIGHFGEPFIEANYLTGSQKTLIKGAISSIGHYERIAFN